MTWTVDGSGSTTLTGSGTEDTLSTPTTNGTYVFKADLVNMALGDIIALRVYDKIDATNYRLVWSTNLTGVQTEPGYHSPPVVISDQAKFTATQSAGTGRAVPWRVLRL